MRQIKNQQNKNDSDEEWLLWDKIPKNYIYGKVLQRHNSCNNSCLDLFENFPYKIEKLPDQVDFQVPLLPIDQCKQSLQQFQYFIQEIKQSKHKVTRKIKRASIAYVEDAGEIIDKAGVTPQEISAHRGLSTTQVRHLAKEQELQQLQGVTPLFLNKFHIEWINSFINQSNIESLFNIRNIYCSFLNHFRLKGGSISVTQFRNFIHSHQFSFKIPLRISRKSTTPSINQEKFNYIQQFCSLWKQGFELMFLDECSLAHNSTPKKIWQKKDKNLYAPHQIRIKANSLIGCIGTNGFLNFQQLVGYVDSDRFISYFQILINQAESYYHTRKFIIILDNAPIHKSSKSMKILEQQACLFLPPYSPQLNPIEQLWNQIKSYILKRNFLHWSSIPLNCSSSIQQCIGQRYKKLYHSFLL